LYATGDRARWRGDGTVDFLGRIDGQVKLRGQRLELGEIEAVLREQPGGRSAAAAVKGLGPGNAQLVRYVVTGSPVGAPGTQLRQALRGRLPEYMVPGSILRLDALPLSPNGKLDRGALPVPDLRRAAGTGEPPRTPTELAVAAIWCEVLGVESVTADDD